MGIERNYREDGKYDVRTVDCPFCGEDLRDKAGQGHLAPHLRYACPHVPIPSDAKIVPTIRRRAERR